MKTKCNLKPTFISSVTVNKRTEIYDTVVSGFILRVTEKGHKSYALRYWYDGQSKQITIGKVGDISLGEARDVARDYKQTISKGIDPARVKKENRDRKPTTFYEAVESYKEHHLPTLKETSRVDYEYRIKHLIKGIGKGNVKARGFDGSCYIKDMKRYEIIDFINEIGRSTPTNAKRLQAILSGIFKHAKNREWVSTNIASEISVKNKSKQTSKWQNTDLDDQQIKKLWTAFDNHTVPVGFLFQMLLLTGQRSGETRLMKWNDIDFDKQLWTIPASDTKNGLTHYVPLSAMALDILNTLKPISTGKYVFESPVNKGMPLGSPQKSAQRIRDKYKVNDFNIHSLRTTVATRIARTTPPQVLSKILNHKKPGEGSIITAIYNKYDYEQEKRMALYRWANELQKIVTGCETNIISLSRI